MEKKENLEIRKSPEELTEQDLKKINGGDGDRYVDCYHDKHCDSD